MKIEERNRIFEENMGLLYSTVFKMYGRNIDRCKNQFIDLEELNQVGAIAFLRAIENYNEDIGCALSTYVVPCIRYSILKHIGGQESLIKIPRIDTIKDEEVLNETLNVLYRTSITSMNRPQTYADGNQVEFGDTIGVTDSNLENLIWNIDLGRALDKLNKEEQYIIHQYYFKNLTQKQLSAEIGNSQAQTSRTIRVIISKIQKEMGVAI